MQGKLFQRCMHLLYCSVLSLGGNVKSRAAALKLKPSRYRIGSGGTCRELVRSVQGPGSVQLTQGCNARKVISEVYASFVLQCTVFHIKNQ